MNEKLQGHRWLKVIPSDTIMIPFPGEQVFIGAATATVANKLQMASATFTTNGVKVGDIIYNTTDNTIASVTAIDSDTTLSVSANVFANAETFVIYRGRNQAAGANKTSVVFIGVGGDVSFVSAAGDVETFKNLGSGTYHPVNAVRINATGTTATNIIALW